MYEEQKLNPLQGDQINKLIEDFVFIGEEFSKECEKIYTNLEYKKYIKEKVRHKVFDNLRETQSTHIKVSEICYQIFRIHEYMNSHLLTNHELSLLFSLWSRTVRSVKSNFGIKLNCFLGCLMIETQEHWLLCKQINANRNTHIDYRYFYGSLEQQIKIFQLFSLLEEEREELTDKDPPS